MRESKTELKHNDVKYIEKDDWRGIRGDGKEESRQPRINEFKRIEKD